VQFLHDQEIDLPNEMESDFDQPLGEGTGGAAIFGKSGGVMIAALRYAYWVLTGETLGEVQFSPIPGYQSISEASLTFTPRPDNPVGIPAEEITLNVAVVAGLGDAKKFLKAVGEGKSNHHFVEVMACAPYGCIGGGGNLPVGKNKTLLDERKAALTAFDDHAIKKGAQDNESVRELYEQHLGKPGKGKAHDLLHTHYESKKN
jgi:iron only hydrogenase large subunit-like protein